MKPANVSAARKAGIASLDDVYIAMMDTSGMVLAVSNAQKAGIRSLETASTATHTNTGIQSMETARLAQKIGINSTVAFLAQIILSGIQKLSNAR